MDTTRKIGIGADHAGYEYKVALCQQLKDWGFEVKDFGTYTPESVDYPDYVHPLAKAIEHEEMDMGVLVCGTGNGVCMTANKYPHIRAGMAWKPELASLTREHNNANVLCLPSRFISIAEAIDIMRTFFESHFEGGRHAKRVEKIPCHLEGL